MPRIPAREHARPRPASGTRAAASADAGGIQSIVRAFAILETVGRSRGGLGLVELARSLGLHSSTTFNLARTMAGLGYLQQSPEDRRYRLGRPLLSLAANAVDDLWLVKCARTVLDELSRVSGETGHFAAWAGDQVVVLAKSSGAGAFQLSDRIGGARPAHATALGKVLLAGLPDARLDAFLEGATLTRFTAATVCDGRALRAEIARVRRTGLAHDNGEFHDDVRCMAVAVRDFSGQTVGALGLSGPVWRLTGNAAQQAARLLAEAAERFSRELGAGGISEGYSPAVHRLAGTASANGTAAPSTAAHAEPAGQRGRGTATGRAASARAGRRVNGRTLRAPRAGS
jgi:DNA-binding IclR family transcriptional regulator